MSLWVLKRQRVQQADIANVTIRRSQLADVHSTDGYVAQFSSALLSIGAKLNLSLCSQVNVPALGLSFSRLISDSITMTDTVSDMITKAILAGNVCAFVSAFLNPLDVTKIRMQNQKSAADGSLKYKGMISGAFRILKEEGLAGWAKGLTASMIREVTYSSVRMGAYEPIRASITSLFQEDRISAPNGHHVPTSSPVVKFTAALISGGVGSAIVNPLDLVKTRFQASNPGEKLPYSSTYGAIRNIYQTEGMRGLYKGWVVTSSRAAILTSAQLGSYDTIKNNILINLFGFKEGFLLHFAASMASGLITTTAANPGMVLS